jgi:UDP-3-O-acyl N-acetylglucosamine deacetylase
MKQLTLKTTAEFSGPGLHNGNKNRVLISPAPAGSGLVIINRGYQYVLNPELVLDTKRGTTIKYKKSVVHTVEHLISSLKGMDVDNAVIEIDGDEPPAADGSAGPYVEAIKKSGLKTQSKEKIYTAIETPLLVEDNGRYLAVLPCDKFRISYFADFSGQGILPSDVTEDINPAIYEKNISGARTFGFKSEIGWLIKAGLIKGASLDNAILLDKGQPINGPLRFKDELTRHKILDIIGDFGLLNSNLKMHIIAVKTGHKHNVEMVKKIAKSVKAR